MATACEQIESAIPRKLLNTYSGVFSFHLAHPHLWRTRELPKVFAGFYSISETNVRNQSLRALCFSYFNVEINIRKHFASCQVFYFNVELQVCDDFLQALVFFFVLHYVFFIVCFFLFKPWTRNVEIVIRDHFCKRSFCWFQGWNAYMQTFLQALWFSFPMLK